MNVKANDKLSIRQIFNEARAKLDVHERSQYLDRMCGNDGELRQRVEAMIAIADCPHTSPLDRVGAMLNATEHQHATELNGATELHNSTELLDIESHPLIGPYKLLEQIGEGGMGVVYAALQQAPIRRTVALKLIKPGMDSRQVVARFEAERQALAMMNHPHIAKVLDAGATESGRPYFVMELVKGIPVTEYCDRHKLDLRERLDLFVKICGAVQHAHQKGIIHRDLKPSNILVELDDVRPLPKVIDFGVAKAIHQPLTANTLYTGLAQMIGTPLYMSPEQAQLTSEDVDTRSDIYSLGVLLYELLTGTTPFDRESLKQANFDEARRMIREVEPPRPSDRISTLAAAALSTISERRHVDPRKLSQLVRGELDWIVLKALEKDRSRRYATANALAADVERYLHGEAVQACPPTLLYRFGKYSRRHKLQLIFVATVASLLLVATLVSSSLASWAISQKGVAQANLVVAKTNEAIANRERHNALDSKALAQQQQQLAQQQERLAQQQRDAAEFDAYVANIQLAYRNWARGDSLFKSLTAATPKPGRHDFRGWEWYFLHSQVHSERFMLQFQQDDFAWSPTGNKLAAVDQTGLVHIWNMSTGLFEKSFGGCPGNISSLAWSPDGKLLAAGSDHHVVAIWDIASGIQLHLLHAESAVLSVDWNPDSIRLACAAQDGTVTIWDSQTASKLRSLVLNNGPAIAVDWDSQGNFLLADGGPVGLPELVIWDTIAASEVYRKLHSKSKPQSFSLNGQVITINAVQQSIIDWVGQGSEKVFEIRAGYSKQWRTDGRRLAIRVLGRGINILDVEEKVVTQSIPGHAQSYFPQCIWSPTGSLLASSAQGEIKIWETDENSGANPLALSTPGRNALSVAFSPDSKRLLEGAQYGLIKIWDVGTGEELLSRQSKKLTWNRAVAFSPDGLRFAAIDGDLERGVVIHDANTGNELLHCKFIDEEVRSMAWSPDGKILAVGYRTRILQDVIGRVGLFNTRSGELIAKSDYAEDEVNDVAWRPDGKQLAASGGTIRIWDSLLNNEKIVAVQCSCLDWSPDGKQLASGNRAGIITIYNALDWNSTCILEGHNGYVETLAWHPFMPRVASGSRDGTARIFDTSSGRELCMLDAHGVYVQDVSWSPDGLRLATAGHDGQVRIWDGSPADRYLKEHGDLREQVWQQVNLQQYQPAIDTLSQLQKLHPDEKELQIQAQRVQWLQAMDLAVAGQITEGVAIFDRLEKEQADVPDYRLYLPAKLFVAGQHDAAIAMAEQLVKEFPARREYRDELGFLYESQITDLCRVKQFAVAIPILHKLAEQFSDRPDFRSRLVYELTKSGLRLETMQTLEKLAQAFDDWPDYRPELARRFSTAAEHDLAANIYQQLIADHPEAVEYAASRKSELAFVALSADQLDKAGELLKELQAEEIPPKLRDAIGNAYLTRATKHLELSEFDKAIPDLLLALENITTEQKSFALYWLALAQLAVGREDDYRASCAQMLEQFGGTQNTEDAHWLAWTCALTQQATSDFAIPTAAAEVALRSDTQSVWYLTTSGAISYRSGELEDAKKHLSEASTLAETATLISPAYTWYFLAMVHHQLGQEPEAQEWLGKANARSIEELGNSEAPKEVPWNRSQTLKLLRSEAESLIDTSASTDTDLP